MMQICPSKGIYMVVRISSNVLNNESQDIYLILTASTEGSQTIPKWFPNGSQMVPKLFIQWESGIMHVESCSFKYGHDSQMVPN